MLEQRTGNPGKMAIPSPIQDRPKGLPSNIANYHEQPTFYLVVTSVSSHGEYKKTDNQTVQLIGEIAVELAIHITKKINHASSIMHH